MAWQLLIQCTVKLIQKWKCKIRTFVFSNWKVKLPAFQNTFTAKLLHGEGQAPRSCTVLSTAVPLRGHNPGCDFFISPPPILLILLLFWCCQIQLLQMHWLLTLKHSCFIGVCPSVRMLCDIETTCAANDMETGGIYCPSNQNHEAPHESLSLEHNLLSIITGHEVFSGLSHAQFSCDSASEFM